MSELIANHWVLLLVLVGLYLALVICRWLLPDEGLPYEKRPSLVTESERKFFQVLSDVAQPRWHVCTMVRLADVIRVRKAAPKYQAWQNRIQAKHLDFVLCDPQTLEAKLAVELDDPTHQRPDRVERDAFVDAALSACHLPLLRIPTAGTYPKEELLKSIEARIGV